VAERVGARRVGSKVPPSAPLCAPTPSGSCDWWRMPQCRGAEGIIEGGPFEGAQSGGMSHQSHEPLMPSATNGVIDQ
jgi:hypothetical protein